VPRDLDGKARSLSRVEPAGLRVTYSLPHTIRLRGPRTLIVFIIVGGIWSLAVLVSGVTHNTATLRDLLVLVWLVDGALFLLSTSSSIILLSDRVRFKAPVSRREISYLDIRHVEVRQGATPRKTWWVLQISHRSSTVPLKINLDRLDERDRAILIDTIATHAPWATFNLEAQQLREEVL
jgi:hypothetical protein